MSTGSRLREVREYLCLSPGDVSERTGLDAQRLEAVESGAASPGELELQRLARLYRYPSAYFSHGSDHHEPSGGSPRLLGDLTEHDEHELDQFLAFLHDSADC
ncbi:MAG: putative transcriptional regulatory protein [Ramlibacter sp.]|jgi:transcriptional regulator with XRE-family HTH domain|nr:putative transcriptional regulatory protein [Ramlibacter sp.]